MFDFPRYTDFLPGVEFESSRSPAKSESWKNPNLQCCAAFPTLPVITRVTSVRYQTSQALVTCSCPFCDCSCQFVYGPQKCPVYQCMPSTDISGRFESRLSTILLPFAPFFFELMVSKTVAETFYLPSSKTPTACTLPLDTECGGCDRPEAATVQELLDVPRRRPMVLAMTPRLPQSPLVSN